MKDSRKITIQELVDLLSEKTSVSKQQAENFIKSLFAVIEENLLVGEQVKINNFGTFKLQWNEPRKSVNVNTGEEFIIDGFHKLNFIPEQKLKDTVNLPLAHLKTVVLDTNLTTEEPSQNDPLHIFQKQATEIKDILSEISAINEINEEKIEITETQEEINEEDVNVAEGIIVVDEEKTGVTETQEEVNEGEINEEDVNVAENIIVVDEEEIEITETQEEVNEVIVENIQIDDINIEEENLEIITERKNKKKSYKVKTQNRHYGIKYTLLFILVIIIGLTIAYFSSSCFECWVRYDLLNEKGRQNLSNIENTVNNWFSGKKSITDGSNNNSKTNTTSEEKPETIDEIQDLNLTSKSINTEDDKTPQNDVVQPKDDLNSKKEDTQSKVDSSPKKDNVQPNADANSKKEDTQKADVSSQNEAVQAKTDNKSDSNNSLEQLFKGPRVYNEFIATETIGRGVSLTLLAHKHYGDRDFWVYIHEANNNKYENPGNIPAGVEISIPKLDKRLIDASNPLCKEKARELQSKYMKN